MSNLKHTYNGFPKLPMQLEGSFPTRGWDIETLYGVDAVGRCWMNMAHGDPCQETSLNTLTDFMDQHGHEEKANVIRALCGVPLPEPKWMAQARAAGWTPPR